MVSNPGAPHDIRLEGGKRVTFRYDDAARLLRMIDDEQLQDELIRAWTPSDENEGLLQFFLDRSHYASVLRCLDDFAAVEPLDQPAEDLRAVLRARTA